MKNGIDIFSKEIAFGLSPFETIYIENGVPHLLYRHYSRLKRTCRTLNIKYEYDFDGFRGEISGFLKNQKADSFVLKIAAVDGNIFFKTRSASYTAEKYIKGLALNVSKVLRDEKNLLIYFKTFNYGTNYIEDQRAKADNYDTCLFLNRQGAISEAAYANIFFRKGLTLYTPHIHNGILPGIMRKEVIKYAIHRDFKVIKETIKPDDLGNFEECFITNCIAGVFPVNSIQSYIPGNRYTFKNRDFCTGTLKEPGFIRPWNSC